MPFSMIRAPGAVELLMFPLLVIEMLHGPCTTTGAPLEGAVSWATVDGQLPVQNVPAG